MPTLEQVSQLVTAAVIIHWLAIAAMLYATQTTTTQKKRRR